ncbi:glycosyltransferase family 2 protein (plasmid) [Entomospira entomophila]|uniref:Glycosyltransferase family 2 protein n=1 Tax=Entomospira entomophila TaxID=2719988 RepID=A0A968KTF5_9SPIO|nr:glycosyltransferase family 2 protein [Entomospira entomophilus]NIZ41387.1 glycosyltransferase family 2 protein [Entomospira entomophilus]WDI36337.1 glycosyltransferase family 2 protein [Entomospira entomophilus]
MKISIIVPFYNVEAYFRECLESIVTQSYTNLEIILVNDCSLDGSLTIAREFAQRDERIQILEHTENRRQGGARNTGANVATGEYLWFIDSDDRIAWQSSVEQLVQAVQRHHRPEVISFSAITMHTASGRQEYVAYTGAGVDQLLVGAAAIIDQMELLRGLAMSHSPLDGYIWHKWINRSFWQEQEFVFLEHTVYEDMPWSMLPLFTPRLLVVAQAHYVYRIRAKSTMTGGFPSDFDAHLVRIFGQIKEFSSRYFDHQPPIYYWVIAYSLFNRGHIMSLSWRTGLAKSIQREPQRITALYEAIKALLQSSPPLTEVFTGSYLSSLYTDYHYTQLERLIASFAQETTPRQQYALLQKLFVDTNRGMKQLLRMILPYGLMERILQHRGWQITVEQRIDS